MKKLLLLLGLAAVSAGVEATGYSYPVTLEKFITYYRSGEPGAPELRNLQQHILHQKAQSFIDGLKEGSEGTVWCHDGVTIGDEIDNVIYHKINEMRKTPEPQYAGKVILAILKEQWPCKPGGRK